MKVRVVVWAASHTDLFPASRWNHKSGPFQSISKVSPTRYCGVVKPIAMFHDMCSRARFETKLIRCQLGHLADVNNANLTKVEGYTISQSTYL